MNIPYKSNRGNLEIFLYIHGVPEKYLLQNSRVSIKQIFLNLISAYIDNLLNSRSNSEEVSIIIVLFVDKFRFVQVFLLL